MRMLIGIGGWMALLTVTALAVGRALAARAEAVRRACHEVRGPLTAALMGLELERREAASAPVRLRAIDLELRRAALALKDLDNLGRATCRTLRDWEQFDLRELLADSVEAWRAVAACRGVELKLMWLGAPAYVCGDRFRLAQATGNLIANAIEHGGGRVEIRVWGGEREVGVEVIDDGPGLRASPSKLARCRRARRDRRSRGRGLAIAQAAVAAHGGRLAAAPCERGARLVLKLPRSGLVPPSSTPTAPKMLA